MVAEACLNNKVEVAPNNRVVAEVCLNKEAMEERSKEVAEACPNNNNNNREEPNREEEDGHNSNKVEVAPNNKEACNKEVAEVCHNNNSRMEVVACPNNRVV